MRYEEGKVETNASSIFAADSSRVVRSPFGIESASLDKSEAPKWSLIDFLTNQDHVNRFDKTYYEGGTMIYVGMDVSSKDFVIHAIDDKGKIKFKGSIAPSRAGLESLIGSLGIQKKLFVYEAGNQMRWIHDYLKKQKQDVHVVHPNEVKWITANQGKKTDKVDAKKLAELARLDGLPQRVLVVEGDARELRDLVNARAILQKKRIDLCHMIRGYAKQEGFSLPLKFFTSNDWQVKLEKMKLKSFTKTIIVALQNSAEKLQFEEKELLVEINKYENKKIELIKTIPAIGDLTARILFAALVEAERFKNKKAVANYSALAPTIYQSGNTVQMGPVNRDGRKEVRTALLQCAHCIARMKAASAKPLKEFFERIAGRSGKKRAVVALARKLLTVVYGVMKSGQVYDPKQLSAA